jgi:hypothetical protein
MEGGRIQGVGNNGAVNMDLLCSFTMNDGLIVGCTGTNGGGVYVPGGTTFTMNGGRIYLNKAVYGGGVYVANGGTFRMNGGTIEDNWVVYENDDNAGGGVYIAANATMDMSGGAVILNRPSVIGPIGQGGMPGAAMLVRGTLNLNSTDISIPPSKTPA